MLYTKSVIKYTAFTVRSSYLLFADSCSTAQTGSLFAPRICNCFCCGSQRASHSERQAGWAASGAWRVLHYPSAARMQWCQWTRFAAAVGQFTVTSAAAHCAACTVSSLMTHETAYNQLSCLSRQWQDLGWIFLTFAGQFSKSLALHYLQAWRFKVNSLIKLVYPHNQQFRLAQRIFSDSTNLIANIDGQKG